MYLHEISPYNKYTSISMSFHQKPISMSFKFHCLHSTKKPIKKIKKYIQQKKSFTVYTADKKLTPW